MKSLIWITLTNGRKDIINITRPSWYKNLAGNVDLEIIIDDSGDGSYREWLSSEYKNAKIIYVDKNPSGFANATSKCFEVALDSGCKYVLHTEDDFVLNRKLETSNLINILKENKNLSQISLQRQPWYDHEKTKDTIIDSYRAQGHEFTEKESNNSFYMEHSFYWTTNPNIYPIEIARLGWPKESSSEIKFTKKIFSLGYKSAFYEKEGSEPYVTHIGHFRVGSNY
jgi:hypothetical protein